MAATFEELLAAARGEVGDPDQKKPRGFESLLAEARSLEGLPPRTPPRVGATAPSMLETALGWVNPWSDMREELAAEPRQAKPAPSNLYRFRTSSPDGSGPLFYDTGDGPREVTQEVFESIVPEGGSVYVDTPKGTTTVRRKTSKELAAEADAARAAMPFSQRASAVAGDVAVAPLAAISGVGTGINEGIAGQAETYHPRRLFKAWRDGRLISDLQPEENVVSETIRANNRPLVAPTGPGSEFFGKVGEGVGGLAAALPEIAAYSAATGGTGLVPVLAARSALGNAVIHGTAPFAAMGAVHGGEEGMVKEGLVGAGFGLGGGLTAQSGRAMKAVVTGLTGAAAAAAGGAPIEDAVASGLALGGFAAAHAGGKQGREVASRAEERPAAAQPGTDPAPRKAEPARSGAPEAGSGFDALLAEARARNEQAKAGAQSPPPTGPDVVTDGMGRPIAPGQELPAAVRPAVNVGDLSRKATGGDALSEGLSAERSDKARQGGLKRNGQPYTPPRQLPEDYVPPAERPAGSPAPPPAGPEAATPAPTPRPEPIPRPEPARAAAVGKETAATGADPNRSFRLRYRLGELDDLLPSHDADGNETPGYDQALQPRGRDRMGSKLQTTRIANEFNPEAVLNDVGLIDRGPVIADERGQVLSGNGRTIAMRSVRDGSPEKWAAYREALAARAAEYGLRPEDVRRMKNPVVWRELVDPDVNRQEFAREANESGAMSMSTAESSRADAARMPDGIEGRLVVGESQSIDDALMSPANAGIVKEFVGSLPKGEVPSVLTADGRLNRDGLGRMRAALFARTYQGEAGRRLNDAFTESLEPGTKNVESAVFGSLPHVAQAEGLVRAGERRADLSIADDISKAVDMFMRLKQDGKTVREYLDQGNLFGKKELTDFQERLLGEIDASSRSPKRLREAFQRYASAVVESGDPRQYSMFGDAERTKEEIWDAARESGSDTAPADARQGGLFASPEAEVRAAPAAAPVEGLGGGLRRPKGAGTAEVAGGEPAPAPAKKTLFKSRQRFQPGDTVVHKETKEQYRVTGPAGEGKVRAVGKTGAEVVLSVSELRKGRVGKKRSVTGTTPENPIEPRRLAELSDEELGRDHGFKVVNDQNLKDEDGNLIQGEADTRTLNSAAIGSEAEARRVIREEGAHLKLLTEDGRAKVDGFVAERLGQKELDELEELGYTRPPGESVADFLRRMGHEYIAKQAREGTTVWRDLVQAVKEWLNDAGIRNLTNQEAAQAILRSLDIVGPRKTLFKSLPEKFGPSDYNLPRGTIVGGAREIGKLYDYVTGEMDSGKRAVRFRTVSHEEARRLEEDTGLTDLAGMNHTADSYGIKHAISEHGSHETETSRGQIPVTREDFERIPEIVSNYDKVEYVGKDPLGNDLIRYRKRFNGTIYYTEEVRTGRHQLVTKSLWKSPAAPGALASSAPVPLTSETPAGKLPRRNVGPNTASRQGGDPGDIKLRSVVPPEKRDPADALDELRRGLPNIQSPRPTKAELFKRTAAARTEQARGAAASALQGMRDAGSRLWSFWRNQKPDTDLREVYGEYDLAVQKSNLATARFVDAIKETIPDQRRREAIYIYAEAGGNEATMREWLDIARKGKPKDKVPPLPEAMRHKYELALQLTPSEKEFAALAREYWNAKLQQAIDTGMLDQGVRDYVFRTFEGDAEEVSNAIRSEIAAGKIAPDPDFIRKRIFEHAIDAELAGLKVKADIGHAVAAYDAAMNKALASRAAVKQMLEAKASDGAPLVQVAGVGKELPPENAKRDPELLLRGKSSPDAVAEFKVGEVLKYRLSGDDYRVVAVDEPGFVQVLPARPRPGDPDLPMRVPTERFERRLATDVEEPAETGAFIIRPKQRRFNVGTDEVPEMLTYFPIDHPALKKWKWLDKGADGMPIIIEGDLVVHPEAIDFMKSWLGTSAVQRNKVLRGALRLSQEFKSTLLSLSGFHQSAIVVHAAEHKVNPFNAPPIDLNQPKQAGLVRGGLMVAAHDGIQELSEGLHASGLTNRIPGIGDLSVKYGTYLFGDYIPRVKMAMAIHALERNQVRYAETLTPEQEAGLSRVDRALRAKTKKLTERQIYRLTAEQANAAFGEQNWVALGRSKTFVDTMRLLMLAPDFLVSRMKFVGQAMKPYGREQSAALIRGAVGLALAAQTLNYILSDDHKMHWDRPFNLVINGREYALRTIQGDLLHLLHNPQSFVYNRVNPTLVRPVVEWSFGTDQYGNKRTGTDQLKDFFTSMAPIPLQGFLRPKVDRKWWESVLQAIGVNAFPYRSKASRTMQKYAYENMPRGIASKEEKLALEAKREAGAMIASGDFDEAARTLQDAGVSGAELRRLFRRSKTPREELRFRALRPYQALEVWQQMDEQERRQWGPTMREKIRNSRSLAPAARIAILKEAGLYGSPNP